MSWKISDYDQRSISRICIRNSRFQKIQKTNEREIVECDNLCYFMSKKLLIVFKRSQKHNKKQLRNTKNQQIRKQDIKITVNIKRRKIQVLIDSTSDISYMNSQLWKSLRIKEKKQKQLLIIRNARQNKIMKITKKMKEINMNIINHQKQIMFSEMKMSEHKIMLKMNWLQ